MQHDGAFFQARVHLVRSLLIASLFPLIATNLAHGQSADGRLMRNWSDNSKKFSVRAAYVDFEDGQVRLEKEDGSSISVPLERLSATDRAYVARRIRSTQNRETAPAGGGRAAASSSRTAAKSGQEGVIERAADAVVAISTVDTSGDGGLGSGFIIDPRGMIATNYHVIEGAAAAQVQFRDGSKAAVAGCLAYDRGCDLAILALERPAQQASVLSSGPLAPPRLATPVITIGHPRGFTHTVSTGIINAVRQTSQLPPEIRAFLDARDDVVWLQTDAVITNGSSGGPVLDTQGRVLGIVTWTVHEANLGFAVHVSHLARLKQEANRAKVKPLPLESGDPDDPLAPLEKSVGDLLTEFRREMEEVATLTRQATPREQMQAITANDPRPKYYERFMALGEQNRRTRIGLQSLIIAMQMVGDKAADAPRLERAAEQLTTDHIREKGLKLVALRMAQSSLEPARALLRELLAKSPHREVQGAACLALAMSLGEKETEDSAADEEAIALLERAIRSYGDVRLGSATVKQLAEPELFARQHLAVGKVPPEISGKDVEGRPLRLSQFRGKVAVLDFFADWCPFCAEMYPMERRLLKEHEGKPLVLLGVSSDPPETLRRIIAEKKVTWQCWSDGPNGPIAQQWQVRAFPTIYVLDQEGVIRYKFRGSPGTKVEEAVKKLLEAGSAAGATSARPAADRARMADKRVNSRFIDHGDYVEDKQTGLLWQKDGKESGELNYFQAMEYAAKAHFGGRGGWRVPTREELAGIFPAVDLPFENTSYTTQDLTTNRANCAYWTCELDTRLPDYAYLYIWRQKGGANNCTASRNYAYVRCVHDPVKGDGAAEKAAGR